MLKASPSLSPPVDSQFAARTFQVSPLIRVTLLLLYGALTLPLPALAEVTQAPIPSKFLLVGIVIGGILLYGGLSEQVEVDSTGIAVRYPRWIGWLFRRQWQLQWQAIAALKPRTTGQGGLVYYFTSNGEQAFLLPMRIAGFAELLRVVEAHTEIDTQDIKPLAQPWMYVILLGFSLLLLAIDGWTLWTAAHWAGGS